MPLTEWDSDSVFISLYVATGLVAGADAQSVLLVGPPGTGKSELLRRFRDERSCLVVGDMTIEPLRDLVADDQRATPLRHIVMPEFGRIFSHRDHTVGMVTSLLTSLMTRDAGREMSGSQKEGRRLDFTDKQMGVLAAMPTEIFQLRFRELMATGFLSRFTVLGVKRSSHERQRVLRNIFNRNKADLASFRCNLPQKPVAVTGLERHGPALMRWVFSWNPNAGERFAAHIVSLLPAVTLLRGRTVVSDDDVEVLKLFQPYFNSISLDGSSRISVVPPLPTYKEYLRQRASASRRRKRGR